MGIFNIAVVVLAIIMIAMSIRNFKKHDINLRIALVWIVLWLAIAITAIYPSWLDIVTRISGWEKRLNFVLVASVVGLIYFVFQLQAKVEHLQRMVARSIQEIGLEEYRREIKEQSENTTANSHDKNQ